MGRRLVSYGGFSDFAGSTLVHGCGGAVFCRSNRARCLEKEDLAEKERNHATLAASSIPLVTLGTFLLLVSLFGFNGFSQLAMGTFDDVNAISKIAVNTHLSWSSRNFYWCSNYKINRRQN